MKWEYRQLDARTGGFFKPRLTADCFDQLNRLATEGWELVQAVPLAGLPQGRTDRVSFILRRELRSSL